MKHTSSWKYKLMVATTTGLLITTIPYAVLADNSATASQSSASTSTDSITQDQAIASIKSFYTIPDGYQMGYASYQEANKNSYWQNGVWQINFQNAKQAPGPGIPNENLSFIVDGKTGKVISMNLMQPNDSTSLDNALSEDASQTIATTLLKKLAPDQANSVRLMKDDSGFPFGNTLTMRSYNFVRMVNGIPYSDNSITIRLNAQGDLVDYENRWSDDLTFPTAQPAVTADQAQTTYTKSLQVALQYNVTNYGKPNSTTAKLTYVPYGANGLGAFPQVDAMSGQLINDAGQQVSDITSPAYTPLTDQVTPLPAQELTKDQALALVKQYPVSLDGYELNSSDYQSDTGNQDPQWHFSYNKQNSNDMLNFSVDSKTGDLVSYDHPRFGAPAQDDSNVPSNISYEQAQQTAIKWLKTAMPSRANNIAVEPVSMTNTAHNGMYNIQFVQLHDGIPLNLPLSININASTGDVDSFYFPMVPAVNYPAKDQVITADVAKQDYLSNPNFQLSLEYMPVYDNGTPGIGQPSKVILVYSPASLNHPADELDANTGHWVSPYLGTSTDLSKITDIKGNWAEKYLSNLYLQGILSADNQNKLLPNQAVTRSEAVRTMVLLFNGYYETNSNQPYFQDVQPSDPNYSLIQQAVRFHWINTNDTKFRPNDKLTREELAEWIATSLGYNDLTKVPGVLTNHFHDLKGIDSVHVNDISIASALDLMVGNNGAFRPNDTVTRAEMAVVLTHLVDRLQHKGQ